MSRKANILLVDDHPENLLALEAILEAPGLRLIKAHSGEEALRWLLKEEFAVILLDVQMPGLSGLETAEIVKRREKTRHTPIIFLTAINKEDDYVFEGYSVGAVDYMFKPFDPVVLKSKVGVFVELFEKNAQIQRQAELLRQAELKELAQTKEQRYRNLAEAIPNIVWTTGPDGRFTYFNEQWRRYTGLSPAETTMTAWKSILHPDDVEPIMREWSQALAAGEPFTIECRLRRAVDGVCRWHLLQALPEHDERGAQIAWLGTCTDIDDKVRAQEALLDRNREIEQQVAARTRELALQKSFNEMLLNSAGEGIYGIDAQGMITFINPAGARLLGYEVEELIGKPIHETLHHSRPDGTRYPESDCPIHASFKDGCAHSVADEVFWRKDGSCVPIEYLSTPIRENDQIVGAVITFQDITDRKRAEEAQQLREREFRALVENAPDVIARLDRDMRHIYINPAIEQTTGLPAAAFLGKRLSEVGMLGGQAESWDRMLEEAFETGKETTFEFSSPSPLGQRYYQTRIVPEFDADNRVVTVLTVARDVTKLKQAEADVRRHLGELEAANAELREADRYKDEFLSVISHELRTPLNFIMGFGSTLQDEVHGPLNQGQIDALDKILNGADRMLLLVNDLLDFAKLQAGKLDLALQPVSYGDLVEEVLAHLRPLADMKPLLLEAALGDLPEVVIDEQRTLQVLMNLVGNAIKFTPGGGRVTILAEVEGDSLMTRVTDTGIGISSED
ncbi:MAG: PAS domain S-box protein, partial [Candidatus Sericytochromatia bacterium]